MTTPPKPASAERSLEERERLDYEYKPRAPLSVIEEPELELEALTPLVEPSHERPVGFEPRSELIVEGPASLEPSHLLETLCVSPLCALCAAAALSAPSAYPS